MPTTAMQWLEPKIATLVPQVDAALREALQQALDTLQLAQNVPAALVCASRLFEGPRGLLGHITAAHKQQLRGHDLAAQIDAVAQQSLVPSEIASDMHWVRVRANRARHNSEKITLTVEDAAIALHFALHVLEWFYCECPGGPRLATLYTTDAGASVEAQRRYYLDCVARWSDERYALDKRFVQLTLLLDQGEDAQGPRWHSGSEQFHDLSEVLAHVPEPAVVVLGPPGSGKSTLLRHYELDSARAVLAGQAGDELSQAPLTFFVSLSQYKPGRASDPLPRPQDWLAAQWAARYPNLPGLEVFLQERRLTLLLDALNEMPMAGAAPVQLWKDFLQQMTYNAPGTRVVFSCRHLDYSVTLSSKEQPVPQVRIEPLSDRQVRQFVTLYCLDYGERLWQNLKDTPQC